MARQQTVGGCPKGFSNAFLVPELLDKQREGYRSLGLSLLGSEQPLVGSVCGALCGLLGNAVPGALIRESSTTKKRGGRLPPFCNNLVTQRGICDMNRENPTYVNSRGLIFG